MTGTDALTELFDAFPLETQFAGQLDLAAPWGLLLPKNTAAVLAVPKGQFRLTTPDTGEAVTAKQGDVVVLSPACRHELRDAPASGLVPVEELTNGSRYGRRIATGSGSGSEHTTLLGAVYDFVGAATHPFYGALPPVMHLQRTASGFTAEQRGIVDLIQRELSVEQPGTGGSVRRLVEILLIQSLRRHLAESGAIPNGAIGAAFHPELGGVLSEMHHHPEKPWTVAALAECATMSRSTFSATFTDVVGMPPLSYLRQRRMQMACRLLRVPSLGMKEISSRIGYDSVSAFSTRFKRFSGISPGDYRRRTLRSHSNGGAAECRDDPE